MWDDSITSSTKVYKKLAAAVVSSSHDDGVGSGGQRGRKTAVPFCLMAVTFPATPEGPPLL